MWHIRGCVNINISRLMFNLGRKQGGHRCETLFKARTVNIKLCTINPTQSHYRDTALTTPNYQYHVICLINRWFVSVRFKFSIFPTGSLRSTDSATASGGHWLRELKVRCGGAGRRLVPVRWTRSINQLVPAVWGREGNGWHWFMSCSKSMLEVCVDHT